MAIRCFRDRELEEFFWSGKRIKNCPWHQLAQVAKRKLDMLHFAKELYDLKSPPSNHLETLKGNLKGYYSIRINDQWRVIFRWDSQPYDVAIVDYH